MREWRKLQLGDIAVISYGYTAKASVENIGLKFLRITDIQNDMVNWSSVPYCQINEDDLQKYKLIDQDIVFARTGATTGKSYLVCDPPEAVAASYLIRLRIQDPTVLPQFISKYFQTSEYWNNISSGISGSAQGGFNASKLSALTIKIPPLPEQKWIVAILDEAFEGIDRAIANTEKNLVEFKQAKQHGIDKVVNSAEVFQLPAPDFRVGEIRTTAILFAHQNFADMRKSDRIRACYQHCCLLYINNRRMSNQTLRERFGLSESGAATVSLVIKATKEDGFIKMDESESTSTRYASYLPFWA